MNLSRLKRVPVLLSVMMMALPMMVSAQTPPETKIKTVPPSPARLADGKPNWTGFWVPVGGMMEVYRGPSFLLRPAGATGPSGPPPVRHAPLKSPYKEQYEKILAERAAGQVGFDPSALCLPSGMPRMMGMIYGMELLQTAGQITITSEFMSTSRRIWLDMKSHPDPEELDPTFAGHSIGHWEGDTLVVDTVGVREDVRLDNTNMPISDKLHIVERFTQIEPGILQNEITIDDPKVFEAPWKQVRTYRYRPDLRLQEFVCTDNNRNVGADGAPSFH